MNIQQKIALSISALALSLIIIIGIFSIQIAQDSLMNRSTEFMLSILRQNYEEAQSKIQSVEKVVDSLGYEIQLTYNGKRDIDDSSYRKAYINKIGSAVKIVAELSASKSAFFIFTDKEDISGIAYDDIDGDLLPEKDSFKSLDELDMLKEGSPNENNKGTIEWIESNGEEVNALCVKNIYYDKKLIGYVGIPMKEEVFKDQLSTTYFMKTGHLYLTDALGQLIYHPLIEKNNYDSFKNDETTMDHLLYSSEKLSNGWEIIIVVDKEDVFTGLDKIEVLMVSLIAVGVFIVLIFSYYVSRRIAQPYRYLTEKIEAVGNGNYTVEINPQYFSRLDEVGVLSSTVQKMIEKQRESFHKIKEYNMNLEKLVDERTMKLASTNEELIASVEEVEFQKGKLLKSNEQLEKSLIEIKSTRAQLIMAEKIASSRYIAIGVAHNINTPIGNALTLSTYLENQVSNVIEKIVSGRFSKNELITFLDVSNEVISKVLMNLTRCNEIIGKFKTLSSENRKLIIDKIRVRTSLIRQLEKFSTKGREVLYSYDISISDKLEFLGDREFFDQIFEELIVNSIKHGFNESGPYNISISASRNSDKEIEIVYLDNGVGIDENQRKELFTPLFTTNMSGQFGLGLSVIYKIVEDIFHGDLNYIVDDDSGTGFRIILREEHTEAANE